MSYFSSFDGVRIYYEEEGSGPPIIFAHEFGGDWRSWQSQVDHFSSQFRCIRYCARGFMPSAVPASREAYGQEQSTKDLLELANHLQLDRFHLVGLSMGSFTSLLFSLAHPGRAISLTLAGCSSGPRDDVQRTRYRDDLTKEIMLLERDCGDGAVRWFVGDDAYQRMPSKRSQAWRTYCDNLRAQSAEGAINTLSTLHWNRISIYQYESQLRTMVTPTLLAFGDEDHALIEPTNAFLAANLPHVRTSKFPQTGHLVNIENPDLFNVALEQHIREAHNG
jgi:pimeloyl-ACP methyl ester carboxylesterase